MSIHRLHQRMLKFYESGDWLEYFKLNQAIHTAIVQASENAALSETHELLQARIRRVRFTGTDTPVQWACAVAEHEEMMEALIARDGERLAKVMARHLDATKIRVRDGL